MKRRDFISSAAAGMAGASLLQGQTAGPGYIELRFFRMHQGDQGRRLNDFWSKGVLPAARKAGFPKAPFGPWGFFNVEMGPTPTLVQLLSFSSLDDAAKMHQALRLPEIAKAAEAMEADAEPGFDRCESSLLRACTFSPALRIADAPAKPPRVFELRVYASDTAKRQAALVKRMGEAEVAIFKKSGFDNIFFSYMIAFDDMAARDKAWSAFRVDPDWVKVREASVKESGQIVSNITNYILRPTAYSPIQ